MRIDIVTLFPEFFVSPLQCSLLARAIAGGVCNIAITNPRDFAADRYRTVDDTPYGGGAGMVLKPEPLFAAVESLPIIAPRAVILLTPQGRPLKQVFLRSLAADYAQLVLLCGHYEGVDERVRAHLATHEISLGDFVLTGGEIPALALIDGIVRLLPGTVGNRASLESESFEDNLLEYPQYTRPADFRGWQVPEVLLSGHHAQIAHWRREQQLTRTRERRPDLLPPEA
ncbi:tRNA (guanosine(37)-N1)-methyltransferase TrmD [Gloeobacter violaceus]|uniref:tRNA (guanine-N(1)-)-methyltransferase n=1 Tax=Gloeobacter violaceus (strain ATCC 29082 / PCC 7421) TaxID=251221 RepID=TRMD_GLOVI|nr:tRNA (guanosine(37)-N1)-methyltransferase TrmD [Gloeobacter violaceus]Q7MBC8.1 RecName: Full=tRNA (guanine-N(1)-)-methyltransferase; AltName: Full=M1G-methyltransferase; AltName: Full=tRNA [GM37] methyltransferase [Gloeobacter violaceus PCC 7421]BAC88830.1 tRNA methyltransferase [Gloeobacter violaceus PCC 7421]